MRIGPITLLDPFELKSELLGFALTVSYCLVVIFLMCAVIGSVVWVALALGRPYLILSLILIPFWVVWRYGVKR